MLNGLRVMVTRPIHQQRNFTKLLLDAGAVPISFPLLEICACKDPQTAKSELFSLLAFDYVIFVSPNAVTFTHNLLPFPWQQRPGRLAAIGDATARTLLHYGVEADIAPAERFSSEALLELEAFQFVKDRRIGIVCGDAGRSLLRGELTRRGAEVKSVVVYHSMIPNYTKEEQDRIFSQHQPQVICITSNQGILNLKKITDDQFREQLLHTPLVVNSERCRKLAMELGFQADIVVAGDPGDRGQLEGLLQWYSNTFFNHSE